MHNLLTFLTFIGHLRVPGRPLFKSSCIFDIDPCLRLVGSYPCLPFVLSIHMFICRLLRRLPETSTSHSDFVQIWLCSRFKQWLSHFSLLFSRKVSTGLARPLCRKQPCRHFQFPKELKILFQIESIRLSSSLEYLAMMPIK